MKVPKKANHKRNKADQWLPGARPRNGGGLQTETREFKEKI